MVIDSYGIMLDCLYLRTPPGGSLYGFKRKLASDGAHRNGMMTVWCGDYDGLVVTLFVDLLPPLTLTLTLT